MSQISCSKCRSWEKVGEKETNERIFGRCRKYAPNPRIDIIRLNDSTVLDILVRWPYTYEHDWCGESEEIT